MAIFTRFGICTTLSKNMFAWISCRLILLGWGKYGAAIERKKHLTGWGGELDKVWGRTWLRPCERELDRAGERT